MGKYRVKEIFGPTIQGEGAHAGRPCVFLRFAACNLACSWCDTDFSPTGAPILSADEIATELIAVDRNRSKTVIVTGGEPALQWSTELADATRNAGFRVHMETNGTTLLAAPVDWLTVSPKPRFHPQGIELVDGNLLAAHECKVVADDSIDAAALERLEARYDCEHWFVQPCDGDDASLARSLALIAARPRWRLSLQLHKIIGVP